MTDSETTSFAVPQHPLPEEIQQMKRDETICKFCGVSYLIHNEVKALQKRLAEAEKQMEFYKGSVEREKVLKEKVENMNAEFLKQSQKLKDQEQQLELFKSDLKMKAKLINDMYLQKRQYESNIQEEQSKSEKLSSRISHLSTTLQCYSDCLRQQKESLNSLRKDVLEHKMLSREFLEKDVKRVTEILNQKVIQERHETETKWKKMNEQLLNYQNQINHLHETNTKSHDLQTKYNEIQNKLHVYEKHMSQLEEGNKILRNKNTTIENDLIQKSRDEMEVKNSLEIVKREKQDDNFKYNESLMKKDEELKKLNALCKSLEKLMNEKSAAEKEVREKVTDKDVQLKNLEETVNGMRAESGKLRMEREQTIVAHHNRIEQLRESYAKKLEASENTCRMLQNELDEIKRKVDLDIEGSQRSLKEEFEKELQSLNTKHSEEIDIMEIEIKDLKDKVEQDSKAFRDLKEEMNQLKNTLSTYQTRNAQEVQKYQNEILDLKRSLEALQHKKNGHENNDLKTKYEAMQKSLQNSKTQMKVMEQTLTAKNNEMSILQDTVRRECEERLELTQALSDARMHLLSIQQNPEAPIKRLKRPTINNSNLKKDPIVTSASYDMTSSETCEIIQSRRVKSTGSERITRESVDSFRERIAAALGRESRFNHSR